jgi:adenosine deaminase
LSHEYHVFCDDLGLAEEELKQRIIAAGDAAFLPDKERALLIGQLKTELNS